MSDPFDPEYDGFDDYEQGEDCANCGGEGYVSHCFQEFACKHPDEGCEDCMRRCDWCNPAPRTAASDALSEALRKILSDALEQSAAQTDGAMK